MSNMVTKWELFSAMINGTHIDLPLRSRGKITGRVMAIAIEDGGGHCFNVTIGSLGDTVNDMVYRTVFVRTID